jgi:hypothetical protein
MAATGYDVETQRGLRARDPHEVLVLDEYGYQAVFAPLRNISIGETLTVLTLLYVSTIAAFNAAYFANVPGNFAEFFSLTDLIQTNIPILQYFFSLALTYFLAGLVISFVGATTGFELSLKVGDGGNREGGISWGCLTPPLLHRRSDMPCRKITSSS